MRSFLRGRVAAVISRGLVKERTVLSRSSLFFSTDQTTPDQGLATEGQEQAGPPG